MVDTSLLTTSNPARPMRADARRNHDRIVAAARQVFAQSGTSASLDEIARRAGVGAGTLYRHFPTRDDLIVFVTQDSFQHLHRRAIDLRSAPDPGAALETYLEVWLEHTAVCKGAIAEVMNDALDGRQPCAPTCAQAQEDAHILLKRAQDAGKIRPDVTQKDIWRLFNGVAMGIRDADISEDESRTLFNVIFRGLCA